MKPCLLLATAAGAVVMLASQASAQTAQDPGPPTQTTTPSGPIDPAQKRSIFDKSDELRTADQQQKVEGASSAAAPMPDSSMSDATMAVAAAAAEPAVVTNGPVLDTAENRAKYPPLSRAGKRTSARGN